MLTLPVIAILMTIVFFAFVTETTVGFGSTILTVTLGANLVALNVLLPAFVPLNVLLSLWIILKYRSELDHEYIIRRILPSVAVGMALGMAIYRLGSPTALLLFFSCFVAVMAVYELFKEWRGAVVVEPLSGWQSMLLLGAGGVVHGLFGSGGPLIVYVASKQLVEKARFRATLAALWLVLNITLLINFQFAGDLTRESLKITLLLLPMLALGIVVGDRAHHILPQRLFRLVVWGLLLFAASILIVRNVLP